MNPQSIHPSISHLPGASQMTCLIRLEVVAIPKTSWLAKRWAVGRNCRSRVSICLIKSLEKFVGLVETQGWSAGVLKMHMSIRMFIDFVGSFRHKRRCASHWDPHMVSDLYAHMLKSIASCTARKDLLKEKSANLLEPAEALLYCSNGPWGCNPTMYTYPI